VNSQPRKGAQNDPARKKPHGKGRRLWTWIAFIAPAVVLAGVIAIGNSLTDAPTPAADPSERDPALIAQGVQLYRANCSSCHGADLRGTGAGPPLLDVIYAPNHHADEAFQVAVVRGVAPHHWPFGAMPPIAALSREDVAAIVEYVRSEQAIEGILSDPSHP
jgi:mono/diheme cytochrome c family protein